MVQNGSNDLKGLKKSTLFSNYAQEILTLFNLTHLCTNFVLVFILLDISEMGGFSVTQIQHLSSMDIGTGMGIVIGFGNIIGLIPGIVYLIQKF